MEDTNLRIHLVDGEEKFIGIFSADVAAQRMGISRDSLLGFLRNDGYCVTDTPTAIKASVFGEQMFAVVSPTDARDVAEFIERMIPTHCPTPNTAGWQAVADALHAISNDSDCIVTDVTAVR